MKKMKTWLVVACLASLSPLSAQTTEKSLSVDDLVSWQRITQQEITDDGLWVACRMEPWKGDATVYLYDKMGEKAATFETAGQFQFSASSHYLLVDKKPRLSEVEALKIKKTKADKMPMNALVVYKLHGSSETIDSVKSYRLANDTDWLAYQSGRKDSTLYVRSLDGTVSHTFPSVISYGFAKEKNALYMLERTNAGAKISVVDPETGKASLIKEGKGEFSQITFDEKGLNLAFLYADDEKTAYKDTEVWLASLGSVAKKIAGKGSVALPEGWVVSQYTSLNFSKSAARLYFGTSPEPRQKDTLQLEENRPSVQVWSWDEPVQYTVQQYNKSKDLRKSYRAVYSLKEESIYQLATLDQPDVMIGNQGDGSYAITSTSRPYSVSWMWEGRTRSDYYVVSLSDGKRRTLAKADYGEYHLSPAGNYAYWYAETDSCWYTLSLADGQKYQLTNPKTFVGWDEDNDRPDFPQAYGAAGWSAHDKYLYLYEDRKSVV